VDRDARRSRRHSTLPFRDDWRLPNAFELATIIDFSGTRDPALAEPFQFFGSAECTPPVSCFQGSSPEGCGAPLWASTSGEASNGNRAFQLFPNRSMRDRAGALRCHSSTSCGNEFGLKVPPAWALGWVLPVRGP
jgi:hypothetical protein